MRVVAPLLMAGASLLPLAPAAWAACSAGNPTANVLEGTPTSDFADHGDGTVTHIKTGLMWKRCAQGQTWDGSTCSGGASGFTWAAALAEAVSESLGGYNDWRLPNAKELMTIRERCGFNPSINSAVFPNPTAWYFWSSSTYTPDATQAWYVYFDQGYLNQYPKTDSLHVRLVRGGHALDAFDRLAPDTHPTPFSFTSQSGVALSSVATSNSISVSGISASAAISVMGGSYAINGGGYTSGSGTVNNGDTVTVRQAAAASYNTTTTATLTIDIQSANFVISTLAGAPPAAPTIGAATAGNTTAVLGFTSGSDGGMPIDNFRATCSPGGITASATASPINVSGLANGTSYTCTVAAHNSFGWGPESAPSNAFIPGVQRVFVSATTGSDANVASNCSLALPCASLAAALGVTASGGEVIALATGEYGPVNIDRSVSIIGAVGQYAALTSSGGNAVTIAAPALKVSLRNLHLVGTGASHGVYLVQSSGTLEMVNCTVSAFSDYGIYARGAVSVQVLGSTLRQSATGASLFNGVSAVIAQSRFEGHANGAILVGGDTASLTRASVLRSLVTGRQTDTGVAAQSLASGAQVKLAVTRTTIASSAIGVAAQSNAGATVAVAVNRSRISHSLIGLLQSGSGAVLRSAGNNTLAGNVSNTSGTMTPLTPM